MLNKIANHLYEYTLSDDSYWKNAGVNIELPLGKKLFGCSACQNGFYRGRNYDWNFVESDLCVIHTTKTKLRKHASVGIADLSFVAMDKDGKYDFSKLQEEKIPFVTVDGINDAGVCIQVNVIPYGEHFTSEIKSYYRTPDPSDDLSSAALVRYILDFADSVEDAIRIIKSKDIDPTYKGVEEFHWMISGPTNDKDSTIKTVVVEFFPKKNEKCVKITEKFVENKPIMTNFNVFNFVNNYDKVNDKRLLTGLGMGYERWQILQENFNQGDSVMGMFDLMKKVWYSKMYDLYQDRFWYSEYALVKLCKYYKNKEELKKFVDDKMGKGSYEKLMKEYGDIYYIPELWGEEGPINGDLTKTGVLAPAVKASEELYKVQDKTGKLWITIETSIYDLKNKTLHLSVRESQDLYEFKI